MVIYMVIQHLLSRPLSITPGAISSGAVSPDAIAQDSAATDRVAVDSTAAAVEPQVAESFDSQAADSGPGEASIYLPFSEEQRHLIAEKLRDVMEDDRLYLDENLSLPQLARELNIPAHHLSLVINIDFNTSFNGLVNTYRVREAAELMHDPHLNDESILNLAFRAGFNSKASFNRAFKNLTGYTPRDFRQNPGLTIS